MGITHSRSASAHEATTDPDDCVLRPLSPRGHTIINMDIKEVYSMNQGGPYRFPFAETTLSSNSPLELGRVRFSVVKKATHKKTSKVFLQRGPLHTLHPFQLIDVRIFARAACGCQVRGPKLVWPRTSGTPQGARGRNRGHAANPAPQLPAAIRRSLLSSVSCCAGLQQQQQQH